MRTEEEIRKKIVELKALRMSFGIDVTQATRTLHWVLTDAKRAKLFLACDTRYINLIRRTMLNYKYSLDQLLTMSDTELSVLPYWGSYSIQWFSNNKEKVIDYFS